MNIRLTEADRQAGWRTSWPASSRRCCALACARAAVPGVCLRRWRPAQQVNDDDVQFDDQGVRLVVSRDSLPILDGMELDYRKEGLNEAFKFNNPNVKDSCGCGESFSV